jgi:hypothetical protein
MLLGIFAQCALGTWCLKKVCRKLNGSLSVPLNTTELGGGIQQALTFVECSQEHLRAQESSTYLK